MLTKSDSNNTTDMGSEAVYIRARQKGEYHLEYHNEEVARLAAQHEVFLDFMGKLAIAPVDLTQPNLRILDSGTADGRWLLDLHNYLPSNGNTYIGTDSVEKMFPSDLPKSITLHAQRIDAPWPKDWSESFDYVHQRLVLPGCENCSAATAVKNICTLVKPGGWIELLEQDHNSPNPGAFDKAEEMIREIFTVNGFGYDYPLHMKDWLEAAGMEDIRQEVFDVPVGALNPNPELAQKSTWQISSAIAGFLPMARALPLSMPRNELDNLPKYTEDEMNRVGGVQRIYVVYGRKPMEG